MEGRPSAPQSAEMPDVNAFLAGLFPAGTRPRPVRKLYERLTRIDARKDIHTREDQLVDLARWVKNGGEVPALPGSAPLERGVVRRFRLFVEALWTFPGVRERFSRLVQSVLADQSAQTFFAKMGIPGDRGLFSETVDRLSRRLMPQPIDEQEITQTLARMFPARRDAAWLIALPPDLLLRFIDVVRSPVDLDGDGPRSKLPSRGDLPLGAMPSMPDTRLSIAPTSRNFSVFVPLRVALLEAILLLASRVSSAGLSDAIRARSPATELQESPFFRLPRSIDALLATPRHDQEEIAIWAEDCRTLVQECRDASASVFSRLESAGVSVDVVYRLELIDRSLRRIELLLAMLVPQSRADHARRSVQLLAVLLEERRRDLSLTDIARTNTRLLARKVIERAGQTGEHYITTTPSEYVKMFFSAAGGGILTAGTAALKFFISALHRPPLQEGLLATANYAGSFMLMQMLGFTLATKQPSMTAAALAGSLKDGGTHPERVVTMVARLVRSQLAAAAGNVIMVIPAAYLLDMYIVAKYGRHVLGEEYAHKTVLSLHPTQSGTIAYAALTGVILWLSSIAAGWLENWAVYRRLPEAIAEHRIRRFVGHRATAWASRVFARNIAGVGGNFAIGSMLGFVSIIGVFAGAPLEARHVTLSTGSLTFAVISLGRESLSSDSVHAAMLGIGIILALNLTVSFALAFIIALRAREVTFGQALRLIGIIALGFIRSPFRFFLPVEKVGSATSTGHGHH